MAAYVYNWDANYNYGFYIGGLKQSVAEDLNFEMLRQEFVKIGIHPSIFGDNFKKFKIIYESSLNDCLILAPNLKAEALKEFAETGDAEASYEKNSEENMYWDVYMVLNSLQKLNMETVESDLFGNQTYFKNLCPSLKTSYSRKHFIKLAIKSDENETVQLNLALLMSNMDQSSVACPVVLKVCKYNKNMILGFACQEFKEQFLKDLTQEAEKGVFVVFFIFNFFF